MEEGCYAQAGGKTPAGDTGSSALHSAPHGRGSTRGIPAYLVDRTLSPGETQSRWITTQGSPSRYGARLGSRHRLNIFLGGERDVDTIEGSQRHVHLPKTGESAKNLVPANWK